MKRITKTTVTAAIILAMIGGGALAASAESKSDFVGMSAASIGIEPFSSAIVSRVSYSITRTSSSVNITLNGIHSGRVRAVVQRLNAGIWTDHAVIADDNFPASIQVVRSRAIALTSGTYRIRLTVTASGHIFNDISNSVVIS
jgi:hypothetical protein